MYWGYFYLSLTLLVLAAARWRGGVSYDAAVALLVWSVMVAATYQYGAVETVATMVISIVFIVMTSWLIWRWQGHWVTVYLLVSGFAMLFWNSFQHQDPYAYKAVKNGIYAGMLIAVAGSLWTTSQIRSAKASRQSLEP